MSLTDFQSRYQVNPILLVGGVASTTTGGIMAITSILSPQNYANGILSSSDASSLSQVFGQFSVMPGQTLMDNEIAHYPLANQSVAANAVITNPLRVSLKMVVAAYGSVTLERKQALMTSLKGVLDNHTAQGGYYTVCTPGYLYTGCLLTSLVDASTEEPGAQPQTVWIWNFEQPLLTEAAAVAAQNQAMSKITNQTTDSADPPGSNPVASSVGVTSSSIAQGTIPATSNSSGALATNSDPNAITVDLSSISPISPGF